MKFAMYTRAQARLARVEWTDPVASDEELRRALHPHQVESLRHGRLRRPFDYRPPQFGRRSQRHLAKHPPPEPQHHPRGALVFAYEDEACFFIELPTV